jgi:hypothetical protein
MIRPFLSSSDIDEGRTPILIVQRRPNVSGFWHPEPENSHPRRRTLAVFFIGLNFPDCGETMGSCAMDPNAFDRSKG